MTRPRRRAAVLAACALLGACSAGDDASTGTTLDDPADQAVGSVDETTETTETTESTGPAGSSSVPTSSTHPVTESSLDWSACGDDVASPSLDCATLSVPLDHEDPDGPTLDIAVARLPASGSDRIGSLVLNPGGPGGSGIEFLQSAEFTFPLEILQRFDLVGFDPRGVGASSSVDCDLTVDDGIELVAGGDRPSWDALRERTLAEFDSCVAAVEGLPAFVGTNNAARDLELLREALGDEALTYVGFSYGTRLGATYAELFPDRVRALVLDGGVAPTDDLDVLSRGQAGGFDLAYGNFVAACDADPDCPLRELGPTADVVDGLRAEIAEVGSFETDDPDRVLTPGELDLGIVAALYSREAWPFLAQAVYLGEVEADGTLFQVLVDGQLGRRPDGSYTNQVEAGGFVNCADDPRRPGVDEVWETTDAIADLSDSFDELLRASTGCLGVEPAQDPLIVGPASGAPPLLVIGTTGDPATPYEWSVELAESLDSGVLYTVEGDGHTAYTSIECVAEVVDAYLIDLEVPPAGGSCSDPPADVFPPVGESEIDLVIAFVDCLIDEGVDLEPITLADVLADPLGEEIFADIDPTDPVVGAAALACADLLPTG